MWRNVITDLESDQGGLIDRFIDALWGEIARRKEICNAAGADDADEYNLIRAEKAREGVFVAAAAGADRDDRRISRSCFGSNLTPMRCSTRSAGRAARYWVHLLMASQDIDTRAEKLLENVGLSDCVARQHCGQRVSRRGARGGEPAQGGRVGVICGAARPRISTKFRTESLWRDYRKPGAGPTTWSRCPRWGWITLSRNCSPPMYAPLPALSGRRRRRWPRWIEPCDAALSGRR